MRIRNEHIFAFREGKLDEIPEQLIDKLKEMHNAKESKPKEEPKKASKEAKEVKE